MEIKNKNDIHSSEYLKKLSNTQRHLVTQKEAEIDSLKKLYSEKQKIAKIDGEMQVFNQEERNKKDIEQSLLEKEKALEKVRNDLQNNQEKLENSRKSFETSYQDQIDNLNKNHEEKIITINTKSEQAAKDLSDRTNHEINELMFKSSAEINKNMHTAKMEADEISRRNDSKINLIKKSFGQDEAKLKDNQEQMIKDIEKEHEKNVLEIAHKNQSEINQKLTANASELKNEEVQHQDILKQKRLAFEQKYNELEKNHTELINRLKVRFSAEIQKMVDAYSNTKKVSEEKGRDDFYRVTKLEPQVLDLNDHYIISLPVSEHEKELVNLTAQERNVTISLNRRYADKLDSSQGEHFKTNRTELLSNKFSVQDIMDSKKVSQTYENGELKFKIMKL